MVHSIATARGKYGSSAEYLFQTQAALESHGILDARVKRLADRVRAHLARPGEGIRRRRLRRSPRPQLLPGSRFVSAAGVPSPPPRDCDCGCDGGGCGRACPCRRPPAPGPAAGPRAALGLRGCALRALGALLRLRTRRAALPLSLAVALRAPLLAAALALALAFRRAFAAVGRRTEGRRPAGLRAPLLAAALLAARAGSRRRARARPARGVVPAMARRKPHGAGGAIEPGQAVEVGLAVVVLLDDGLGLVRLPSLEQVRGLELVLDRVPLLLLGLRQLAGKGHVAGQELVLALVAVLVLLRLPPAPRPRSCRRTP